MDLLEVQQKMVGVALAAGEIIIADYSKSHEIFVDAQEVLKSSRNISTETDLKVDEFAIKHLEEFFPDYSIITEESRARIKNSRYSHHVDPIDGSIAFLTGISINFCYSDALCDENDPIVAVIYNPLTRELFSAIKGQGAFLNGERLQIDLNKVFPKLLIPVDSGYDNRERMLPILESLFKWKQLSYAPSYAGGAYTVCAAVKGIFPAYISVNAKSWDFAASTLIAREYGLRVLNIARAEFGIYDDSMVVVHPAYEEELFSRLPIV